MGKHMATFRYLSRTAPEGLVRDVTIRSSEFRGWQRLPLFGDSTEQHDEFSRIRGLHLV